MGWREWLRFSAAQDDAAAPEAAPRDRDCAAAADLLLPVFTDSMIATLRRIAARVAVFARLPSEPSFLPDAAADKAARFRRIVRLIHLATPYECSQLVHASRYHYRANKRLLSNNGIANLLRRDPEASVPGVCMVSLLAADGHVREAAVRALDNLLLIDPGHAELAFPFILQRLCDWVRQVREAAEEALAHMLPHLPLCAFFEADAFLCMLERSRRAAPASRERIAERIAALAEATGAVEEMPLEPDDNRRFVMRVLAERADAVPDSVWSAVSARGSTFARLMATRHLSVAGWDKARWRTCLSGRSQPDPRVRRTWLLRLCEQTPGVPFETALYCQALLDSSPLVRDAAAYALRTRGEIDPTRFYREKIAPLMVANVSRVPAAWASGLAAVAGDGDAGWFREWLATEDSRLRAAGLLGLSRICPEEADKAAVALLHDIARPSRKAAARWLTARKDPGLIEAIRKCFAEGGLETRQTAFRLLLHLGGMARVIDIFAALPDEALRPAAWDAFIEWGRRYGWHNQNASAPYTWRTLPAAAKAGIAASWDRLLSEYAFIPPRQQGWQEPLLERYPPPHGKSKLTRGNLGSVPVDAWYNWSQFPQLLEELAK